MICFGKDGGRQWPLETLELSAFLLKTGGDLPLFAKGGQRQDQNLTQTVYSIQIKTILQSLL